MDKMIVTLGLYFEISDSEVYGGVGSVGYANINVELDAQKMKDKDIPAYVKEQTNNIVKMCKVDSSNVKLVNRLEYEENMKIKQKISMLAGIY